MMRISEFAKSNGLAVDTIHYYLDLNLLHPIHKGKYFGESQQGELEKIEDA